MEQLMLDLIVTIRTWRRRPVQSGSMITTLALGLAATIVVGGLVRVVLLDPLPYPRPDRLAVVHAALPGQQQPLALLAGPELTTLRERSRALAGLGGIWARPAVLRDHGADPTEIEIGWVTEGFLDALQVAPLLGRLPTPDETRLRSDVTVIAYALWRDRYDEDPSILGRRLDLDGEARTVVGVMPPEFRLLFPPDQGVPDTLDAWAPWGSGVESLSRSFRVFSVVARMKDEASWESLAGDLGTIGADLAAEHVDYASSGFGLGARPLSDALAAPARPTLLMLIGVVALVLLIVCANVTNGMLTHAAERARELRTALALGAPRSRIWRQWLTEAGLAGVVGALAGTFLAGAAMSLLAQFGPVWIPRLRGTALDSTDVLLGASAAILAAITVGSLTAAHALASADRTGLSGTSHGVPPNLGGTRRGLIVVQIALSLVLASGAGLLLRTFVALNAVPLGFDPAGVVSLRLSLPDGRYPYSTGGPRIGDFYRQLDEQLAALPGVRAAGSTLSPPLSERPIRPKPYAYRTADGDTEWGTLAADARTVTLGWFSAVSAELVSGRFFDADDRWDRPIAVVVDTTLAQRAWPGAEAVGQAIRVELFREGRFAPAWGQVVGVVRPVRMNDLAGDGREQLYLAHQQSPQRTMFPAVRVAGDPLAIVPAIQRVVRSLEPGLPVFEVRLAEAQVASSTARTRFALTALGGLAALAVLLAAGGVYTAMSFHVGRRQRELGIRLAIGAAPHSIRWLVLREAGVLIAVGIAAGLLAARAATRTITSLLFGVAPADAMTLGTVAVLLAVIALAAGWIPAWRASRLDPSQTLRTE